MTFVRGLDFSLNQGAITLADWRAIARGGIRFGYIRCAEGLKDRDPKFDTNVAGARAAGIVPGPYFVGEFGPDDDPIAQADAHWAAAKGCGSSHAELPPVLDFEVPAPEKWGARGVTGASLGAKAAAYVTRIGVLSGRVPVIYSYPWFLKSLAAGGADMDALALYRLWLAAYPNGVVWPQEGAPMPSFAPWGACTIWQVSDGGGRLPNGCPVDTNVVASEEAFQRLLAA